jgi:hypothetical protein
MQISEKIGTVVVVGDRNDGFGRPVAGGRTAGFRIHILSFSGSVMSVLKLFYFSFHLGKK